MSRLDSAPRWIQKLERPLGWLAIPNIALLLITCQIAGFLFVTFQPDWYMKLVLIPQLVTQGEPWRLFTFLALPITLQPLWAMFSFYFLYFLLNSIEENWGAFATTLYVLISIGVTIAFSFVFQFPVTQMRDFQSTLFMAAACLFPEMTVQIFFVIPAKMKWLAWLTGGYAVFQMIQGDTMMRLHLIATYSSFILFFGPTLWSWLKNQKRRADYRRKFGN